MKDSGLFQKCANIVKEQDEQKYRYAVMGGDSFNEIVHGLQILNHKFGRETIFFSPYNHPLSTRM